MVLGTGRWVLLSVGGILLDLLVYGAVVLVRESAVNSDEGG